MLVLNTSPQHRQALDAPDAALFAQAARAQAARFFSGQRGYRPTPLRALPALARQAGVAAIHVKDESARHGLNSFKALGGLYAAARAVRHEAQRVLGRPAGAAELRRIAATVTLACATDGNHGRAVAAGPRLAGAQACVFVHPGVSAARRAAIAGEGARVVEVAGSYDDSVAAAASACAEPGWRLVSDTSWAGEETAPGWVMQGYTVLVEEALAQLPQPPTHLFIQAGVGGLAAALAGCQEMSPGPACPCLVVVEPARAACLLASLRAGGPVRIEAGAPTVMAMLECHAPSPMAWRILARRADAFMTVDEDDALAIMNTLARPSGADPVVVAGESGGVGLAGALRVAADPAMAAAIGLDTGSRIFVINTEGATDPARYRELVGIAANPASTL